MRHPILLTATFFFVIFFILIQVDVDLTAPGMTGATVADTIDGVPNGASARVLDHVATDFFGVEGIMFPNGDCGEVARELYSAVAFTPLDTSSGFSTDGPNRLSTLNFVIDRTSRYGTIDMSRGRVLVGDQVSDSFISLNTETIVRVPKEVRTTYFSLDLYGTSGSAFIVDRGRFSTPSVDCDFIDSPEGNAICNCKAHSISGIRVAGITGVRTP